LDLIFLSRSSARK